MGKGGGDCAMRMRNVGADKNMFILFVAFCQVVAELPSSASCSRVTFRYFCYVLLLLILDFQNMDTFSIDSNDLEVF